MNGQPRRKGDVTSLMRPEALQGKAYARLARPPLLANVSLRTPVLVALASGAAVISMLAFVPVSTSFRAFGTVSEARTTAIIRAPRPGQLMQISVEGEKVDVAQPVAHIEQPLQGAGGRDPAELTRSHLSKLADDRNAELRLIGERHELNLQQLTERERALQRQLVAKEEAIGNLASLVTQSQQLVDRVTTEAAGHVTRLDALAISERAVGAKNRHLEIQSELDRLRAELVDIARGRRIVEIDRQREVDEVRRRYLSQEDVLVERSGTQGFAVPSQRKGTVLAAYKQRGDWVAAGDELLLLGEPTDRDAPTHLRVLVPPDLANLVSVGQLARVWANPRRRSESPLSAKVVGIEQTGQAPDAAMTNGAAQRSAFVAEVAVDGAALLAGGGLAEIRGGSRAEVEIIFGSQPLYESLLPRRLADRSVATAAAKPL